MPRNGNKQNSDLSILYYTNIVVKLCESMNFIMLMNYYISYFFQRGELGWDPYTTCKFVYIQCTSNGSKDEEQLNKNEQKVMIL
jgi:hypothetical protein